MSELSQKYCTSCGLPIPDGQGSSCSMCYGDVDYGSDGYYREFMNEWERQAQQAEPEPYPEDER